MSHSRSAPLIYDIGMHKGEDTAFYLEKGFRVVGIEADPDLVAHCQAAFAKEIAAGRLAIVSGAVVADPSIARVSFWKNDRITTWGSISPTWAEKGTRKGAPPREIIVSTIDLSSVLHQYGVPYYMKIDIEGADEVCLRCLAAIAERPTYVSLEADLQNIDATVAQIDILYDLGYDRFMPVQQGLVQSVRLPHRGGEGLNIRYRFEKGASGPFGSDLRGKWLDRDKAIAAYRKIAERDRKFGPGTVWKRWRPLKPVKNVIEWSLNTKIPGWYDTHARHRGNFGRA